MSLAKIYQKDLSAPNQIFHWLLIFLRVKSQISNPLPCKYGPCHVIHDISWALWPPLLPHSAFPRFTGLHCCCSNTPSKPIPGHLHLLPSGQNSLWYPHDSFFSCLSILIKGHLPDNLQNSITCHLSSSSHPVFIFIYSSLQLLIHL